jgi:Zn/Cd-binding protein ZinT
METTIPLEKLTKAYIKLRDMRSKLSAEYKAQDGELLEKQDRIKKALLDHCKEHNVESVKTSEGVFYRQVKRRYWTSDWESMYKFVMENNLPEFFDKRLNQSNVRQFLEENPEMVPPGLNVESEYTVSVRKNKG